MHRRICPRPCGWHRMLFERPSDSLQVAISSAISDVEGAGYQVAKVELEREAIPFT